jgi:hypothetical protein
MSINNKYVFYFVVGFCITDVLLALIFGNYTYIVIFASLIFLTSFYLEERTLILIVSYFIVSIIEFFGHKYITFFKKE